MGHQEDLFALGTDPGVGEADRTLSRIRSLTEHEQRKSQAGAALLHKVTEGSALRALLDSRDRFDAAVEALEASVGVQDVKTAGEAVQDEFKSWLSAFRGFDDRTSAWLSRTFGGTESEPFKKFKSLTNVEYDTNFAYRLCATLRNACEHDDNVINRMSAQSGVDEDGEHFTEATLQFDGPGLADRFDRLKKAVRNDLRSLRDPIEVRSVMDAVMFSCQRIHYGLVVALWEQLDPAVSFCAALHEEAMADGGEWAVFINSDFDPRIEDGTMNIRYNPYNLAMLVAGHRADAAMVLSQPPLDLDAASLAKAG